MRLYSKRRFKIILAVLSVVAIIVMFIRYLMHFQMEQEVSFYRKFFRIKKDGLNKIYDPLDIKQIPAETIDDLYKRRMDMATNGKPIDWDKLAYVNYVTDVNYLCNSLLMFDALKNQYHTKAKLVVLIGEKLLKEDSNGVHAHVQQLIHKLRAIDPSQVVIKTVPDITKASDGTPWRESFTKLNVFNLVEYDRIVYMDNDAMLQGHMDELFFLPDYIKFAAPLEYWALHESDLKVSYKELQKDKLSINLEKYTSVLSNRIRNGKEIYNHLPRLPYHLYMTHDVAKALLDSASSFGHLLQGRAKTKAAWTSDVMVIKPSAETFTYIKEIAIPAIMKQKEEYDMDVINNELYNMRKQVTKQFALFRKLRSAYTPEVLVLPFSRYGLLTGSIKNPGQNIFIENDIVGFKRVEQNGNEVKKDTRDIVKNAKYIHYSDFPLGKPWNYPSLEHVKCIVDDKTSKNISRDKELCDIWNGVFQAYYDLYPKCKYDPSESTN
ncbi:Glucose N-acetyltransferase 1 [Nakaseomyces bracarensis]|uniref:Glucose N-acetyltransferase 1 n=1 Tax=Nakaseomyces bracarensis TaxID=273131 RepID=A0ABR4NPF7_9SACH